VTGTVGDFRPRRDEEFDDDPFDWSGPTCPPIEKEPMSDTPAKFTTSEAAKYKAYQRRNATYTAALVVPVLAAVVIVLTLPEGDSLLYWVFGLAVIVFVVACVDGYRNRGLKKRAFEDRLAREAERPAETTHVLFPEELGDDPIDVDVVEEDPR